MSPHKVSNQAQRFFQQSYPRPNHAMEVHSEGRGSSPHSNQRPSAHSRAVQSPAHLHTPICFIGGGVVGGVGRENLDRKLHITQKRIKKNEPIVSQARYDLLMFLVIWIDLFRVSETTSVKNKQKQI